MGDVRCPHGRCEVVRGWIDSLLGLIEVVVVVQTGPWKKKKRLRKDKKQREKQVISLGTGPKEDTGERKAL